MKRDVVEVIFSLMPYIHLGGGVSWNCRCSSTDRSCISSNTTTAASKDCWLLCGWQPMVCQSMEKILNNRRLSVSGSTRFATSDRNSINPQASINLLDDAEYQWIRNLWSVTKFPLPWHTNHYPHRKRQHHWPVRGKMVGATDFLSKPVNAEIVWT